MAFWGDNSNVTATVPVEMKAQLEQRAAACGLSLSKHIVEVLRKSLQDSNADVIKSFEIGETDIRKVRSQHGSLGVTIPPSVAEHLGVSAGAHLAFTPVHQAVIIRRI